MVDVFYCCRVLNTTPYDQHSHTCPLYIPSRPLRAVSLKHPPKHAEHCKHGWVFLSPLKWNDAHRESAHPGFNRSRRYPEYTEGCQGCNDLIGWRQWMQTSSKS